MRIVFIRTDRLGDTLATLPAIEALRVAYPAAQVVLCVREDLKELLESLPGVARVVGWPKRLSERSWWREAWQLARALRPERFDLAIVANPKKSLHFGVWLAGIPRRVGYACKGGRWALTHRVPVPQETGAVHSTEQNFALIRALQPGLGLPACRLVVPPRVHAAVQERLAAHGLSAAEDCVILHAGSSRQDKQWPFESFRLLGQQILERWPVWLLWIGGVQEAQEAASAVTVHPRSVNLMGRLSLLELAALFSRGHLLISNDSGPVHVASATGAPSLVLFGGTDPARGPQRWGPWGPGPHRVLWKPEIRQIEVEEVLQAVAAHPRGPSRAHPHC